ncbi:hypothetical protein ACNOYE_03640 [Nannocystaceae bacterium ST9]
MRGFLTIVAEPQSLADCIAANARQRERVTSEVAIALHLASNRDAGRVPARGRPDLEIELPAGSLIVGLALLHDSVLLPTPSDRLLNRNVRGLLRGLAAQYFGTEHLVIAGRPVAWVGFDRDREGRVAIEAFVGVDAAIGTRPISDMRGRPYASLRELGIATELAELAARIVEGHARFGVEFEP